jgi:hypothetical protein
MIFGAVAGLLGDVVKGYFETKKQKAKQKLLQVQAETKIMEKKVTGEIDWDMEMAKASDNSWKDEWLTIIFTIPLIMLLLGQEERVHAFFQALETAPPFYQYLLGVIVAASFGFRGASKFLKK